MFLIFAGVVGFLAGLLLHWFTWTMRRKDPSLTVTAGVVSAMGLTGYFLLLLNSDLPRVMLAFLGVFWAVALLFGGLQSFALKIAWWRGVAGVFFEMGLAFLTGAAVNLTLQRYIKWLNEQFPGIDVYAIINSFLWSMIITLLVLAVLRPLMLLNKARAKLNG